MVSQSFSVKGMSCTACADHVRRALSSADGVQTASVTFSTNAANVEFDPTVTNVEQLVAIVDDEGYTLIPSLTLVK